MKKILISAPCLSDSNPYLPYVYGLLKSYAEADETLLKAYCWSFPIYRMEDERNRPSKEDCLKIDVLGLSCYTWNWRFQMELASYVKGHNPNVLVVAGGPQPDHSDPQFFKKNPSVDIVVLQEGEKVFSDILKENLNHSPNFMSISGLYVQDGENNIIKTGPCKRLQEEELTGRSVFSLQETVFQKVIAESKARGDIVGAIYETNRGCPYACTFCDWGSLTYAKVRKISMDRIKEDIFWLAKNSVNFVFLSDANFGIFKRDVEITESVCQAHSEFSFPECFYYSPTKSKAEFLLDISKRLFKEKISMQAVLSLQHTSKSVLEAIKRKNLSDKDLSLLINEYAKENIPMFVQFVMGCPGDSLDQWMDCLTDVMEMNVHGDYFIFNFTVLPNSPAADKEYREKWGIKTVNTKFSSAGSLRRLKNIQDQGDSELIVACESFSESDWGEMWTYSYLCMAGHNYGLTRFIAFFLHDSGISYKEFYQKFYNYFKDKPETTIGKIISLSLRAKKDFVEGKAECFDETEITEIPTYPYNLKWEEWFFAQACFQRDNFYQDLTQFLKDSFAQIPDQQIESLVVYQKNKIIHYDYNPEKSQSFTIDGDWEAYFSEPEHLGVSCAERFEYTPTTTYLGRHKETKISWHEHRGEERLKEWALSLFRGAFIRSGRSLHETACKMIVQEYKKVGL